MIRKHAALTALVTLVTFGAGCTRDVSFKQDVYPILSENCLSCHKAGAEGYLKSGLSMENYDAVMKGTKFGPIIVAGSHISSTLVLLLERKAHHEHQHAQGPPAAGRQQDRGNPQVDRPGSQE